MKTGEAEDKVEAMKMVEAEDKAEAMKMGDQGKVEAMKSTRG